MHNDPAILVQIRRGVSGTVSAAEPLSRHTTYEVGGAAEYFACPRDGAEMIWLYRFAKRRGIPLTILGWGSNVIAPDEGVDGIVMKTKSPAAVIRFLDNDRVEVDAGVTLSHLAEAAAKRGLGGLEAIAGIPGTIGGAIVMNAGTKEGDTASVVDTIEVVTPAGRKRILMRAEGDFGYRRSIFLHSDWLIARAVFRLVRGDRKRIADEIERILAERLAKFPLDTPNAGSVFKRPHGDYAGRLIEAAGCKGLRVGGAMVSEQHANFIVNAGGATSRDILALIAEVRRRVYEASNVYLELEQIPLAGTTNPLARRSGSGAGF